MGKKLLLLMLKNKYRFVFPILFARVWVLFLYQWFLFYISNNYCERRRMQYTRKHHSFFLISRKIE